MSNEQINRRQIQWFPGHMAKTLRIMEADIRHVDAVLQLLDARIPASSLNRRSSVSPGASPICMC